MKNYSRFTVSDFLLDTTFLCWIEQKRTNENLDLFWKNIIQQFPEKILEIKEAEEVLLLPVSENVSEKQIEIWARIRKSINDTDLP